jgi:hypothetical protein
MDPGVIPGQDARRLKKAMRLLRLAHHWTLIPHAGISVSLVGEFIRPAVRAVPASMAQRLGPCRISLPEEVETGIASRWSLTQGGLEIAVTTAATGEHDIAMELLLCLGQRLWQRLSDGELRAYWSILQREVGEGARGEVDEQALAEKQKLFQNRYRAGNPRLLEQYGRASFAGTAAEYIHCLWHEVTVRTGPEYLPGPALRRRLQLLAKWFPPNPGYRLFPAEARRAASTDPQADG